jgi:predicted acetyltransferase
LSLDIRLVPAADLRRWADAVSEANSEEMGDEIWRDVLPTIEPDRTFGAYDEDHIAGGGSVFSFDVTVPGGAALPSAGITWIGISPTHRRRGALRGLMTAMIAQAAERREPLAVLWASEGSIYQRFGYGLSTLSTGIELERDRAQLVSTAPATGSVRLITLSEAAQLFPPIFEANRRVTPGFYTRSKSWWEVEVLADFKWSRRGFDRKFFALHETDGKPDAYAIYRAKHEWANSVPGTELHVQEIMALDGSVLREMWRFIFGIDLIKRITTRAGSAQDPLLLMLAEPRRLNMRTRDGMWLRVVDVVAALEARTYAADGSVVVDIRDEYMPAAGGRFRLTTSGGTGRVERTQEEAEVTLDAADLGAIYLGGFTLADLARAGRTDELAVGARARLDAMLRTDAPAWCPQVF